MIKYDYYLKNLKIYLLLKHINCVTCVYTGTCTKEEKIEVALVLQNPV